MNKMQFGSIARTAVALACVFALAPATVSLRAQSFFGSIVGTVMDPTGAMVANATVTLANIGTAETRTASSDSNGNYQFLNLVPGAYRVDIQTTGFKHLTRDQIAVRVDTTVRVDGMLEVGEVTQTMEVSAQTAQLQTESATLNQVVEGRQVAEMPLNGRNIMNLIGLVPGVVPQGSTQGSPMANQGGGTFTSVWGFGNYQIGGGIANQNSTYIDGAPINLPPNNATALIPTQDAIQEFGVATNNVSAEFGGFAGGVVNMTTKSGTNSFHGSLYEYLRNRSLNANDFFNNRAGIKRPPFTQNQYGVSATGPVIRNKTFFSFTWEGFALRKGIPSTFTVPTANFRAGNFAGQPTIYDPLSTCGQNGNAACAVNANGQAVISRTPFANNQIPTARFDPTTLAMQKYWLLPNSPGNTNNYVLNNPAGGNTNQYNGRFDHTFGEKNRLFGRYTFWNMQTSPTDPFNNLTGNTQVHIKNQQFVLGDTYTISPTLIADFRIAYLRMYYGAFSPSLNVDMSQFGPAWVAIGKQMSFPFYPGETITGGFRTQTGLGQLSRDNDYSYVANLTKVMGRHTIKVGGMLRRDSWGFISISPGGGGFNFDATFTSATGTNTNTSGLGFASFILGYPTSGSLGTGQTVYQQLNSGGLYVTDTYQVNPKLTLTLGLRWDQPGAFGEKHDNHMVLDLLKADPIGAAAGFPNLKGQPVLVNSSDWSSRLESELHWDVFSPRFGFAYRVTDKTVIRGGYGITHLPYSLAQNGPNIAALNQAVTSMTTTLNGGLTPYNSMSNPFPNGLLVPAGRSAAFLKTLEGGNVIGPLTNQPVPYVQQWNFNIQRDLGADTMFQVTYAGSAGRRLPFTVANSGLNMNQLPTQYFSMGSALLTQVANPFYGILPASVGVLGQKTVAQGYLLKPYPQFLNVLATQINNGVSSYNALQATLQKRFTGGGVITANYTWSKFLSDTDSLTGYLEGGVQPGTPQNWYNLRSGYSLVSANVPQRLAISYVYDLPFGKGRHFLTGLKGVPNILIGGWALNGVATFAKGYPLVMTSIANTLSSQFGAGVSVSPLNSSIRPNVVAGCDALISGAAQSRLTKWFNTSCYQQPGSFALGNASRTDPKLLADGINNFDFALTKSFMVREGWSLQFHTEFFNLFNRVQFAAPNAQVGNPNFGIVTASALSANPRLVQFALRLQF
ncbi:MAG: TonB-dependent receptor [Terriglobia bacterium]|nr:MAG: TonB-dependent receptor [Terriglobia bacterium]